MTSKQEINPQLGRHGSDLDGESEVLQTVDEAQNVLAFGALVEVVCAEVLVEGTVLEHVVGGGRRWPSWGHAGSAGAGIEPGGNFPWCVRPPRRIG
jgi:hypothetical protein